MENTDTQEVKRPSSRLRDRYSKKYPDKSWEGENAESDENLYDYAADELEEYDRDKEARRIMDERMNNAFKDRRGARSFIRMSEGEDPGVALIEEYGPSFLEALESEEGKAKFKEAVDKWKEQDALNEISEQEFNANMDKSQEELNKFGEENGLDPEKVSECLSKIYGWCEEAIKGNITVDMLTAVYKAGKFDNAVAQAREEGEINGRNEKIREKLVTSKSNPSNMPRTIGSKAESEADITEKKSGSGTLPMFGGIPVKKKSK